MISSFFLRPGLRAWLPACVVFLASMVAGCGRLSPIGGTQSSARAEVEPKTVATTLFGQRLELFMEHPYLVRGQGAKFNVHLTVIGDGAPIRAGRLTVVATGPSGKAATFEQDAPRSPGIFGPTVTFHEAGKNEMALTLRSEQTDETLRVPVQVYENENAAGKAADQEEGAEAPGTITFLKEQQWKIGLVSQPVVERRLIERLTVTGEIMPAAGARAVVTPSVAGRVLPPPGGRFPRVGERVKAGQVVAAIEPPLAGPQGVQLVANQAQIKTLETELLVRQMDVEVQIKNAKADLEYARLVYDRDKNLFGSNAVSKRELDEVEHRYKIAETSHAGKVQLREPLERARRELRRMLDPSEGRPATGGTAPEAPASAWQALRIPLLAPNAGTVTTAQATEGEFVDGTRSLFTVINLERVWVEARVPEADLGRVVKAPSADFTLAAYPGRRFAILGSAGGTLIDVGSVVDSSSRTIPVRYEVPNPEGLLKVGLYADVAVETARAEGAIAIPASALVDEDGRPTAYVMVEGETFAKRDLELGLKDSGFVQVKQGLSKGDRVVVRGAYTIRLASVSSVIPAHGHTH